jgi:hypothetical protein
LAKGHSCSPITARSTQARVSAIARSFIEGADRDVSET